MKGDVNIGALQLALGSGWVGAGGGGVRELDINREGGREQENRCTSFFKAGSRTREKVTMLALLFCPVRI